MIMKLDLLVHGGIFNGKCEDIYEVILEYLEKLRKEKPTVFIFPDNYQEDGKKIARGFIKEEMDWPVEDVSYGHFQLIPLSEGLDLPIQVALFCSEPKYRKLWREIFETISSKFEVFDGTLPPNVKPWEHIPDKGYDRKMVELIHKGYDANYIAMKLGYSRKTIYNRSYCLREKYDKEIVPYFQKWRNRQK